MDSFATTYDVAIRRAVEQWWPDLSAWKLWKAQLFQESRLDPNARSGVGAAGLAQIMPATWKDLSMALRFPDDVSPFDAAYAIEAGAYYQGKLRRGWGSEGRTGPQRNDLGAASYNAGTGHILAAQRACGQARLWPDIAACLSGITGPQNAAQTTTYVERINRYWKTMEAE